MYKTIKSIETPDYGIALIESELFGYQVVMTEPEANVRVNTTKDLNMALFMFETFVAQVTGQ